MPFDKSALPDAELFYENELNNIRYTQKGMVAQCPFHDDRHRSFSVNLENGRFRCFAASCGETGSLIDFRMKTHGETFKEACQSLGAWK